MPSTNATLALVGYTTAPSPSYGCKLILKDGEPVGHYDCATAFDLPGMREAAVRLDSRLATFDRACALAMRSGRPLDDAGIRTLIDVIAAGATDPEAALKMVRKAA